MGNITTAEKKVGMCNGNIISMGKKSICIYYLFGVVNIFLYVFSAANCSAALIENSIADS